MRNASTAFKIDDPINVRDGATQPDLAVPVARLVEVAGGERHPIFMSAPAAPDIPTAMGIMVVASYVALILTFIIGIAGTRDMILNLGIIVVFLTMFFAIPGIFLRTEPGGRGRPKLAQFMRSGIETATGSCSGGAALAQILIVPVFLTVSALVMSIIVAIVL